MIRLAIALLGALVAGAQPKRTSPLPARIEAVLRQSPAVARANWGIQAIRLDGGRTLYQRNASQLFTPASNAKLYATALALLRLGPGYQFETQVGVDGSIDNGILSGGLRIVGGGDPSLSGRIYPYVKGPAPGEPLAAIEAFADAVFKAGVRDITGGVTGDDTKWPWNPYPDGWAINDSVWEYGAPVSALTINDNALRLRILPDAAGGPARIEWHPAVEYYWVDNRVRTERGPRQLGIDRELGSRQIRLTGRVAPDGAGRQEWLAIDDPAYFAAHALHEALTRRGVRIGAPPRALHRMANEPYQPQPLRTVLARRESPRMAEILAVVNKASQNLHTEMVLRETGFRTGGEGSDEAGLAEMKKMLAAAGVLEEEFDLRDGSGLSRLDLVTPAATVKLLRHLWDSPHRETWIATLPVGGLDGTLENRFQFPRSGRGRWPSPGVIQAKTGTLSHVATLSGYLRSKTWGPVAFSVMVNQFTARSAEIRAAIDRICLEIAK